MTDGRFGWLILCAIAAIVGCRASSRGWSGTWRLDSTKSIYQSRIVTISISADGEYRDDDGVEITFRCDGKYRPIGKNRMQNCVKSSGTTLDRTVMENGVKRWIYHWEMSSGSQVLTFSATALRPGGPVTIGHLVLSRMSGTNDFAGQWRDTSLLQRNAVLTLRLDSKFLHIGYPGAGQYVDAPLDGADAAVYGPNASSGATFAVMRAGQREFFILGKANGKPFRRETLHLSSDARVITVSWSNSDEPREETTLVYDQAGR